MTVKTPKEWVAGDARCRGIEIDISISVDSFDPSFLAAVISVADQYDLTKDSLTGALRYGGRGKEYMRFSGYTSVHKVGDDPHYHLTLRGTAVDKGVSASATLPKVSDFLTAIGKGIKDSGNVIAYVIGTHRYPRDWWRRKSEWDLPVPVAAPDVGERVEAELTGVEVTYRSGGNSDQVVVSARGDVFLVTTAFAVSEPVGPGLLRVALERSAELGNRLFQKSEG